MKKLIQDFENYLQKVKLSQKVFIYLMPIMIVGAIVFMLITPTQEEELEMISAKHDQLLRDIKRKQPRIYRKKLQHSKKRLLSLKEEIEKNQDALHYLYAKLTNLEISDFNEKKWALTLDKILQKSLSLNIAIDYIKNSNSIADNNRSDIIPKKYIEISGKGSYNATLEYLHFIENTPFIVDIKNIKMQKQQESNNEIQFAINFTIYGVNI
jgi:Tfp pilus assembly protein PilO